MPTALVTGATAGIGAGFARHLAAARHSLVLVARDAARLAAARESLLAAGTPQVELIPADLTDPGQRSVVADRLRDRSRSVDLLINNAGIGLGKDFLHASEEELLQQLNINVTQLMLLSHAALPPMIERGHGAVINVASVAGLLPGRGSTYAGTKAFVISFSEGLSMSLAGTGVRVQALCPGFVRTEFHQRAGIDMSSMPDRVYVDLDLLVSTSLADLRRNRPLSIPGRFYRTLTTAARLFPRGLVRRVASRVNNKGRT